MMQTRLALLLAFALLAPAQAIAQQPTNPPPRIRLQTTP